MIGDDGYHYSVPMNFIYEKGGPIFSRHRCGL